MSRLLRFRSVGTHSPPTSPTSVEYRSTPSILQDSSDLTVDPFLSEYRWNDPYFDASSQGYVQDGHLTIRIPISNEDGSRNTTEEIRVGMAIKSTVDTRITKSQATHKPQFVFNHSEDTFNSTNLLYLSPKTNPPQTTNVIFSSNV